MKVCSMTKVLPMYSVSNPPSKDGDNSLLVPRLRVTGLRGEDLKNSILKLPLNLFYLATRNTQRATPPGLKIRWWIWAVLNG